VLPNNEMNGLFEATVEATEEAILNAMVAAETMTGRDSLVAHALPHDRLQDALRAYGRYVEPASLPRAAAVDAAGLPALAGTYAGPGPFAETAIRAVGGALYLDRGADRRRIVRLTDGRLLLLGTSGIEIDAAEAPARLRLVRDGAVVAELARVGGE
jgi:hypothetical protein